MLASKLPVNHWRFSQTYLIIRLFFLPNSASSPFLLQMLIRWYSLSPSSEEPRKKRVEVEVWAKGIAELDPSNIHLVMRAPHQWMGGMMPQVPGVGWCSKHWSLSSSELENILWNGTTVRTTYQSLKIYGEKLAWAVCSANTGDVWKEPEIWESGTRWYH